MVRNPSNAQLADCVGIRKPLEGAVYDLTIVGAGPAGLAAAVAGFLQMTGSALYSVAVGAFYDGTARPMTTAIALAGVAPLACFWWLRWRRAPGVLA